jgi:Tfp pilus assembly protein PilO
MGKEMKTVGIFALIFLVLAVVASFFVKSTMDKVSQRNAAIDDLNNKILKAQKIAAKEESLEKELANLQENLKHYVQILPSPEVATQEELMKLVQQNCERAQFDLGTYRVAKTRKSSGGKKRRHKKVGGFQEIAVSLSATGTFEQFLRFLNALERHETFLRVNSFTCNAPTKPKVDADGNETWPLKISINVSTFRYDLGGN